MASGGFFTSSDLATIGRAVSLSEKLVQDYYSLTPDAWKRNPYSVFTRREVNAELHEDEVFANVVQVGRRADSATPGRDKSGYGIILQDPNILRAILRPSSYDLWALALFVLTHELVHIVRFSFYGVDFFGPEHERDKEEKLVHGVTREILSGARPTDQVLHLYEEIRETNPN
jgi:hypothetical protein